MFAGCVEFATKKSFATAIKYDSRSRQSCAIFIHRRFEVAVLLAWQFDFAIMQRRITNTKTIQTFAVTKTNV